jgi:pimeloyl-ACP methyl ester carboxylesterase
LPRARDPIVLHTSEILAQNIPHAKFVVLPNQKHNYFASDPATAHKVIRDFLSE